MILYDEWAGGGIAGLPAPVGATPPAHARNRYGAVKAQPARSTNSASTV